MSRIGWCQSRRPPDSLGVCNVDCFAVLKRGHANSIRQTLLPCGNRLRRATAKSAPMAARRRWTNREMPYLRPRRAWLRIQANFQRFLLLEMELRLPRHLSSRGNGQLHAKIRIFSYLAQSKPWKSRGWPVLSPILENRPLFQRRRADLQAVFRWKMRRCSPRNARERPLLVLESSSGTFSGPTKTANPYSLAPAAQSHQAEGDSTPPESAGLLPAQGADAERSRPISVARAR